MPNLNFKKIVTATILFFGFQLMNAQGCSDAGFCTLSSFKPNQETISLKNKIKLGLFFGGADQSIGVWGNYLEYNHQINSKISIDTKLTTLSQNGNEISSFGLGDLFLNSNFNLNSNLILTLGTKIPLTSANSKKNGLPLPMDYQSSLGTLDAIAGIGYKVQKFQFVLAFQQPLTQNNNEFSALDYPENSIFRKFQSTRSFKRSGDVLFRVSYPFQITEKLQLTTSLLPIYHIKTDRFTDFDGIQKSINGSNGLTLNGNLYLDYHLNSNNSIQINMGSPLVVRDSRPDGLTRSFILNAEYQFKF